MLPSCRRCYAYPLVSYTMSPTAFTTSTPATWFMEISREYAIGLKPVSSHIDTCPVKHSCGFLWSCTDHRFWPCYGHSKLGFNPKHLELSRPRRTIHCARDLERTGDVQQRSRYFRFRNGHDRGISNVLIASNLAYRHLVPPGIYWRSSVQ